MKYHETETPTAAALARARALSDRVDRELDADRRFFAQHPERIYRVRRSFRAEVEQAAITLGCQWPVRGCGAFFTIVRQIAPGLRARAFFLAHRDHPTDVPRPKPPTCLRPSATPRNRWRSCNDRLRRYQPRCPRRPAVAPRLMGAGREAAWPRVSGTQPEACRPALRILQHQPSHRPVVGLRHG